MKQKKCRDCDTIITIENNSKKILCTDCKTNSFKNHFKIVCEQKILCKKCNSIIRTFYKKGNKTKKEVVGPWVCDNCKEKGKFEKITRNVFCKNCKTLMYTESINKTYEAKDKKYSGVCLNCKKEIAKNNSDRMIKNNPMKKEEIRLKVKNTTKENIKSGKIVYKKGKEHHLYLGNRYFGMECRKALYGTWIFPILERDNFRCTKCGENKKLQVHHIKPLRSIIKEVFKENNLIYESAYFTRENNEELFNKLLEEVVKKHKLDNGITVCMNCHSIIDAFYKKRK